MFSSNTKSRDSLDKKVTTHFLNSLVCEDCHYRNEKKGVRRHGL